MTTTAAKQMLEGIYAKQFLKHAEGILDSAASSYKKRVGIADNAMAKLMAPKPSTPSAASAATPQSAVRGGPKSTWRPPSAIPDMSVTSGTGAVGASSGPQTSTKPTGFDSRKVTADYQAKLDRAAAASTSVGYRAPTMVPDMSVTSGTGAVAAAPAAATQPAPRGGYRAPTMVPDMSVTSGTGAVAAAPAAATTPPSAPVQNPLTQPVPGRNIELMPDGTPDTSSLIDTPQTQTTPAPPQPPAGSSPQAWGSAGAGPGGAPAAAQTQPQTQQQTQPAVAGNSPEAFGSAGTGPGGSPGQQPAGAAQNIATKPYETVLNDPKSTPEQKEGARADYAKKWLDTNSANVSPALRNSAAAWQKDPNSPEAKAFSEQLGSTAEKFKQQQIAEAVAAQPEAAQNPDLFGQIAAGAENAWNSMGVPGQIALAIGVPLAMVSLLGGSGLGLILGGLGIGAAAGFGGLFGQDTQNAMNSGLSNFGKMFAPMFGVNLPDEGDIRNRLTAAAKQGPQQAQAELEKVRAEVAPYARYSPEAQKFMDESAAKDYMYNQARNYAEQNFDTLLDQGLKDPKTRGWDGWLANTLGMNSAAAKQDGSWAQDGTWFSSGYGAPGSPERQKFIEERMLAPKGFVKQQSINVMLKAARCWAGYEPVPGTKAYSEGSCRPKGSKKTQKEVIQGKKHTEKKAVQQFDVEHARRVFTENPIPGMNPATATPTQLHARMRNIVNPTSNHTNSTAAKLFREQYNNQMPAMPQPRAPVPQSQAPAAPAQAAPAPQPTIPKRPTMIQAPTNTAAMPPIQPGSGGKKPYPMTQQPVRKPPEDPVAAIDRRLARRGIDPSKPVFTRPPQPVVAAPQPSMRAAVTAVKPPVR